jgi:hypothetical protein
LIGTRICQNYTKFIEDVMMSDEERDVISIQRLSDIY